MSTESMFAVIMSLADEYADACMTSSSGSHQSTEVERRSLEECVSFALASAVELERERCLAICAARGTHSASQIAAEIRQSKED